MGFLNTVWHLIAVSFTFIWQLFLVWIGLFFAPFTSGHFDMLWITVPVILNWAFTELYQEKKGTSLGNAISNGVVVLWVGIDWARTNLRNAIDFGSFNYLFYCKLGIAIAMFSYGLFIIVSGVKVKGFAKYIGRIRQVTYVSLVFTPVFYDIIVPDWQVFLSILVFYPVFHYGVEFIDWVVPDPKTYEEEERRMAEEFAKKQIGGPYQLQQTTQTAQTTLNQGYGAQQSRGSYQSYPQGSSQQFPQSQQRQQQYPASYPSNYQGQKYQKPPH